MRTLVESTFVTLDGVVSTPEAWGPPYWDEEHSAYSASLLEPAEALLLGRETFAGFAEAWPQMSGDAYSDKVNAMPKHVISRGTPEPAWNGQVLPGAADDLADAVRTLKKDGDGTLLKFGTGETDRVLLAEGLVDELHLWVFPVLAGAGQRLAEGLPLTHLALAGSTRLRSGITVLRLVPKG